MSFTSDIKLPTRPDGFNLHQLLNLRTNYQSKANLSKYVTNTIIKRCNYYQLKGLYISDLDIMARATPLPPCNYSVIRQL